MRCLEFFFAATAGLSAITSFAQSPSTRIGWAGYYLAFPFRPVADSAVLRQANVRAVKIYMTGSDTLYPDLRDTLEPNCEVQLFNRQGQCMTVYRNKISDDRFEKSTTRWNKQGQYVSNFTYVHKPGDKWELRHRTTWEYDSAGNRIHSLSENLEGKKSRTSSESHSMYDSLGRKIAGVNNTPAFTPYPKLDSVTYSYPAAGIMRSFSRHYLLAPGDSFVYMGETQHFEIYKNGLPESEGYTHSGRDSVHITYSYDKEGRLKEMKYLQPYLAYGQSKTFPLICRITYDATGLPVRMVVTCGDLREEIFFAYLYY